MNFARRVIEVSPRDLRRSPQEFRKNVQRSRTQPKVVRIAHIATARQEGGER